MTKSNITVKIIPKSAFTPQQIEEFRRCTKTVKEAPAKLIPVEALANRYGTDTSSRCDAPLNSVRNQAAPPPIPISAPRRRRTGRVVILVLGVCLVVYVSAKLAMTGYSFYSWVKQFTEIHFTSYEDRFHVKVLKVRSDPDYFMERIRVQCERDMRAGIWVTDLTKAGIFQTNGPNGELIYHEGNPRKIGQSMVVRAKGRYSTCDIFFTVRTTSTNTVWHAEVAGSSCDTTLPTPMTVTGVQTHWPGAYKRGSEIPLADLGNCKILLSVKDTATDP